MMARARIALVLLSAVVIGAGALGGWRISIRFVGAGTPPVSPAAPGAAPRAPVDPPAAAPAPAIPKKSTDLHMTFQREWHPVTYEIGSPTSRPPVRFLCQGCPAVNWATHKPIDQPSGQEKVIVHAATVGAITVVGGRITLMEWDP